MYLMYLIGYVCLGYNIFILVSQNHFSGAIVKTIIYVQSPIKNTAEDTTPIHHKQHPTHIHTTQIQKQQPYNHSTTQHKQRHRNRLYPKQITRTYNRSNIISNRLTVLTSSVTD